VALGYSNPEALKAGYRYALAQQFAASVGGAQFGYDDHRITKPKIDAHTHNKLLRAIYDNQNSPQRAVTDEQLATDCDRRTGVCRQMGWSPQQLLVVIRDLVDREYGTDWGKTSLRGSSHPKPTGQPAGAVSKEKLEQTVNALEFRSPKRKDYHVDTGPHKARERFARVEPGQGAPFSTDSESVPAEARHFAGPIEAKIVSIIEPYLAKNGDASDDKVLRRIFERLPYLEVESRLSQEECRLSILSLLVRRFGRQWSDDERWRTEPGKYLDSKERPARLPRSVSKPSENLREKARELLEGKGAASFSMDDRPKITAAEQERLIERMTRAAR
jgi:hypothetical protein